MPRTLPWLVASGGVAKNTLLTSRGSKPQSRPQKRPKQDDDDETPSKRGVTPKRDFLKSSPTPPSSPIHRCPSEEYIQEGLDHDDIYMMVEDEFYAVAQTFTQHLHYAEYVRRKREAKLQNADAIQDLARPTDGVTPMSAETKRKQEARELSARQRAGLDTIQTTRPHGDSVKEDSAKKEGEGEDGDLDVDASANWVGTSLYDLMLSPRKVKSLVGKQGIKSSTRAAAGFSQSSGVIGDEEREENRSDDTRNKSNKGGPTFSLDETASEEDGEDDDLDVQILSTSTKTHKKDQVPAKCEDLNVSPRPAVASSKGNHVKEKTFVNSRHKTPTTTSRIKSERRIPFDDFDALPEPRKSNIQSQARKPPPITKQTEQKNFKSTNTGSKKSRLSDVPTFLF